MLFKILKGDSSRISTDITPFHDGWCYFTSDDGGFYIDSEDNGVQKRTRINPESVGVATGSATEVDAVLAKTGWENGRQTVEIPGLKAEQNGVIGLSQDASDAQVEDAKNAELRVCGQQDEYLTIAADGDAPTYDIPVTVILFA